MPRRRSPSNADDVQRFAAGGRVQVGGKPVDPRRVKPGLFELPWVKLTYEGFIDDPNAGKLPYYCYLGAVEMAGGQFRDPAGPSSRS